MVVPMPALPVAGKVFVWAKEISEKKTIDETVAKKKPRRHLVFIKVVSVKNDNKGKILG